MNKVSKLGIGIGVLVLIAVIVLFNSFFTVAENEYACVMRFSKIEKVVEDAGLNIKIPFVDSVKYYPKTIIHYDIAPSEVLTSDKKSMIVDCYILWKITDPLTFYKTIGTLSEAEVRIDNTTFNVLKTTMGNIEQTAVINQNNGSERNDLYQLINKQVKQSAVSYGIDIVDVKIKRLDLPDANEEAVYTRMISERNQMAASFTATGEKEATIIRNEVDKEVNIKVSDAQAQAAQIEAEGEKEYMRILGEAYDTKEKQDFYHFIRALDALKASLTGDEKTVILGADSELAKILSGETIS